MSERPVISARPWRLPMKPRDPEEHGRVSTPLELLFDLCFVVAVGADAARLEESLAAGRFAHGLVNFLLVFFAIWWAWMNFTWFASAYDADDSPYRLATMTVMAGALVLSAGVTRAFDHRDFSIVFFGYLVMRAGLESQRLRAAAADPQRRVTMLRYAGGESGCMVLWALTIFVVPHAWQLPMWLLSAVAEVCVPPWAERAATIPWHPHHISERYGLFTIIVLGETILSSTDTVAAALNSRAAWDLALIAAGGLVTVFALWWVYFSMSSAGLLTGTRMAILWGYGHYVVYASGAAVGAGIAVNAAKASHHAHLATWQAGLALAIPVFCYLLVVWLLLVRPHGPDAPYSWTMPLSGLLAVAAAFGPAPVPLIGLVMALVIVVSIVAHGTKGRRTS